jgi:hypothetical protein
MPEPWMAEPDAPLQLKTSTWLRTQASRRLSCPTLGPPALKEFSTAQIAFARQAWPMKAAQELRSAAVFTELQQLAILCALPLDLASVLADAARDELLHAELCFRVAELLGSPPDRVAMDSVEARFASFPDRRQRLLTLLLIEVAVGETVSCSLFRAAAKGSEEPVTRLALSVILRDEARHARIGWQALEALRFGWSEDDRRLLKDEIHQQLGAIEQFIAVPSLRRLESGTPFDAALASLGVLPPVVRVEAFYRAMEIQVLPALDALGLGGTDAWRSRYAPRPLRRE